MIISTFDKYKRFDTLDGARGVASIAVMIYHYTQHNGLHWMEGAWVSVDMFFILSGFVIAHSYGAKIIGGMTFIEFTAIRLIRLGPLYFFGLGLGICAAMILIQTNATIQIDGMKIVKAAMLGLFWVPYRNWASWPFGTDVITASVFPLNDPAWSLFFELFVNVVFFLFVSRFRVLSSPWLVTLAFVVFVFCTLVLGQHNPG